MVDELSTCSQEFFLNDDKKPIEKKIKLFFKFLSLYWYICGASFNIALYLKAGVWNFHHLSNLAELAFNVQVYPVPNWPIDSS